MSDDWATERIEARGYRQREVLDWMMGKPMPEGYEDVGLRVDDEWGFQLAEVEADVEQHGPGEVGAVEVPVAWVDAWWHEFSDGYKLHLWFRDDAVDPAEVEPHIRAFRSLAKRYERDIEVAL